MDGSVVMVTWYGGVEAARNHLIRFFIGQGSLVLREQSICHLTGQFLMRWGANMQKIKMGEIHKNLIYNLHVITVIIFFPTLLEKSMSYSVFLYSIFEAKV